MSSRFGLDRASEIADSVIKGFILAGYSPPVASTILIIALGKVFGMCNKGQSFDVFWDAFEKEPMKELLKEAFNKMNPN